MALAAILGMCALLPWSQAPAALVLPAALVARSTQSQENQTKASSSQSSAQPSNDPQKATEHSSTPQPPAAAPGCPESSQSGSTAKSGCKPEEPAGVKKKRHRPPKAVVPATKATETGPTKTVVRNGGTDDPVVDLSPAGNPHQDSQLESTNQLLASSDENLKKISGRQLSASQQDTVKQIKSYMEQATTAKKSGDVQRAYNLAVKANLLSAELLGH